MSKYIKVRVFKTVYADLFFTVSDEFNARSITDSALRRAAKEQASHPEEWKTDPESFEAGDALFASNQEIEDYDLEELEDEDFQLQSIG